MICDCLDGDQVVGIMLIILAIGGVLLAAIMRR